MFRKVFYIDITEVAQTGMQRNISKINTLNFHTLHQLTAKVQAGGRSSNRSFVLSKNRLETHSIFFFHRTVDNRMRQGRFTQCIKSFFKLVMRAVIKETQGTATRSGIIDHLSHHRIVITEIELIADTDLTGRVYQHIPQTELFIQLAQQKNFDTCTGLFLITVQACRKHLRVIEDKHILIIKIIQDILKHLVFYLPRLTMEHHQTRLISVLRRMQSNFVLW